MYTIIVLQCCFAIQLLSFVDYTRVYWVCLLKQDDCNLQESSDQFSLQTNWMKSTQKNRNNYTISLNSSCSDISLLLSQCLHTRTHTTVSHVYTCTAQIQKVLCVKRIILTGFVKKIILPDLLTLFYEVHVAVRIKLHFASIRDLLRYSFAQFLVILWCTQ